jgi:hypothetical protein
VNLEERFKVEVGRVRTFQEVLDSWNEVKILAKASTAALEAACDLPIGPEREAALAKYDEEFEDGPSEPEVVETALAEIVPDLEQIEALRPMIEAAPESRRAQVTKLFDDFLKKTVDGYIRHSRYWIGMFGMDSGFRINTFSWIIGVEPNYEPLDDPTPEEEAMFEEQIEEMVKPIVDAINKELKK